MLVSRIISLLLRLAEFVSSAIVLGLAAYFLHQHDKHGVGPFGRLIYVIVISPISVILSLVWMIPTVFNIINYVSDLILSAAWFAAFGILQDWYDDRLLCGSAWNWEGLGLWNGLCGQWNAAQAFSFLAAIFWFASFVLGVVVSLRTERVVVDGNGTATRSRWRSRWTV